MKFKKLAAAVCAAALSLTVMSVTAFAAEGDVDINETNFPDKNFRAYVSENCDTNEDDVLSADEIAAVTKIDCSNKGIADLTGIETFTALTYLYCHKNQLTELDVSKNTALTNLYCNENNLSKLDVSKNTALTDLLCYNNSLTELNISGCEKLMILSCYNNQLKELDISGCPYIVKAYTDGDNDDEVSEGNIRKFYYETITDENEKTISYLRSFYWDTATKIIAEAQNTDTSTDPVSDVSETESSSAVDSKPSDNNKPTGAATGLAFAGIALAGAALAVSKKRK